MSVGQLYLGKLVVDVVQGGLLLFLILRFSINMISQFLVGESDLQSEQSSLGRLQIFSPLRRSHLVIELHDPVDD